jgi:nitrogenase subunit NifH
MGMCVIYLPNKEERNAKNMSRWINEDIRNPSRVMWIGCDPSDDETCVNRERWWGP